MICPFRWPQRKLARQTVFQKKNKIKNKIKRQTFSRVCVCVLLLRSCSTVAATPWEFLARDAAARVACRDIFSRAERGGERSSCCTHTQVHGEMNLPPIWNIHVCVSYSSWTAPFLSPWRAYHSRWNSARGKVLKHLAASEYSIYPSLSILVLFFTIFRPSLFFFFFPPPFSFWNGLLLLPTLTNERERERD